MKKAILLFPLLLMSALMQAQTPTLLKDINDAPVAFSLLNSDPGSFCSMNGLTYYGAYTFNGGRTIYRTNGTAAGTYPLLFNTGLKWVPTSGTEIPLALNTMNNELYFYSLDIIPFGFAAMQTYNFVKSDLSGNVTVLAKSGQNNLPIVNTESSNRGDGSPQRTVSLNGAMYFPFSDSATGAEVWKTDGTLGGTAMIKDIVPGRAGSFPNNFTIANGFVFFTTSNGAANDLWRTDGTAGGTIKLKDSVAVNNNLRCFTVVNNKLYFIGNNPASTTTKLVMWQSDGSVAGTTPLEQVSPSTNYVFSIAMKQGNNLIYLMGNNSLTKYDGAAKTVLATITPSAFRQNAWAEVNGTLFFNASNALWKTNGTTAGTVMVKDSISSYNYLNANGTLFFAGNENLNGSTYGIELWKSNGTKAGTQRLSDFNTDTSQRNGDGIIDRTNNYTMILQGNKVLLSAFNGITTAQGGSTLLAASDGTVAGTGIIPLPSVNGGSLPGARCVWNNTLYFSAYNQTSGNELWKTDGTPGGTSLVKDIYPGMPSSYIQAFTPYNNALYFLTIDSLNGIRPALWKTDGTAAGTVLVKDNLVGVYYDINKMTVADGKLLFISCGSVYTSDGTTAGTNRIPILATGAADESRAYNFCILNGKMIVAAQANANTQVNELWNVDITAQTANRYSIGDMSYSEMVTFDGAVYFVRDRTANENKYMLCKTDGTASGTVLVDSYLFPRGLTVTSQGLYCLATDVTSKYATVRRMANGTTALQTMKQWPDLNAYNYIYDNTYSYYGNPSIYYTSPFFTYKYPDQYPFFIQPTASGPVVFPGGSAASGIEIIASDGTANGTTVLKEIMQGKSDSNPQYLIHGLNAQGDSILLFVANNGSGNEIWVSDGTSSGTVNFAQTLPNSSSLDPKYLTLVNGKLVFWGTSLEKGTEPYAYDMNQVLAISGIAATPQGLSLYPNPAHDAINVKAAAGTKVSLYNLTGILLYTAVATTDITTIPVQQLPAGTYMVVGQKADGKRETGKFIKY